MEASGAVISVLPERSEAPAHEKEAVNGYLAEENKPCQALTFYRIYAIYIKKHFILHI